MSQATEPLELQVSSEGFELATKRMLAAVDASKQAEAAAESLKSTHSAADASTKSLGESIAVTNKHLEAGGHAASETAEHMGLLGKASEQLNEQFRESGHEITGLVTKLAIGWLSFEAGKEAIHETMAATIEYENVLARLEGATGSIDDAKEKFEELDKVSEKMIFDEMGLAQAFLQLQQTGLDPSAKALSAYANIAAAFGTDMGSVTSAVTGASLGMYRSLRQFGIRAEEEGGKVKVTFRGESQVIGKSSEEIQQYLISLGQVQFAGAAARQLDTMGGKVKELGQAWEKLYRGIGEGPIGEAIKTTMEVAATAITTTSNILDAFFYNLTSHTKGMSKEKQALLNEFMGSGENWGSDKNPEEDKVQAAIEHLEKGRMSAADKAFKEFKDREKTLLDALANGMGGDIAAALDENKRQYEEAVNGGVSTPDKKKPNTVKDGFSYADIGYASARDRNASYLKEAEDYDAAQAKELEILKTSLAKKEDAEHVFYLKNLEALKLYTGDDQQALLDRNEAIWNEHLEKLATAEGQAEDERLRTKNGFFERFMTEDEKVLNEEKNMLEEYKSALDEKAISEEEYTLLKVKLHKEANEKIVANGLEAATKTAHSGDLLFGNLAAVAKKYGGEQSKTFQALFAAQKAFAISEGTLNVARAVSSASAQPWPSNIPLMFEAAATGAKLLADITGASYSGAFDKGGNIPSGGIGVVGEFGPEIVRGPANVTSRADTAQLLRDGNGNQGGPAPIVNVKLVNGIDPSVTHDHMNTTEGEHLIMNVVKRNKTTIQMLATGG